MPERVTAKRVLSAFIFGHKKDTSIINAYAQYHIAQINKQALNN